uniref:Uncharacterized protein n=1 Tax=Seriola lalandi dorsalis TaxID=1841481 RepID=A0A3B4XB66_SERLL
ARQLTPTYRRGFIVGARASVTKMSNRVSIGAVSMGKKSCTLGDSDALPQVTENVNAGRDQTVSATPVHPQLHRGGYWAAVHKPLITTMTLQWCKKPFSDKKKTRDNKSGNPPPPANCRFNTSHSVQMNK